MTNLLTENARLRAALEAVVQFHNSKFTGPCAAENKGRAWKGTLRKCLNALATPAPDAVQEAARFLAEAIDKDMQTFNHSLTAVDLSPDMPVRHFFSRALVAYANTLRAIAGDRT